MMRCLVITGRVIVELSGVKLMFLPKQSSPDNEIRRMFLTNKM